LKKVAIFLVLLLVVNALPIRAFAHDSNDGIVSREEVRPGIIIEKGTHLGSEFESTREGSQVTIRVKTGNNVEVIEYDEVSPFFSVTTNGQKVTYDRRDFYVKGTEKTIQNDVLDYTINATDPYYGAPYYNVLNGQKTITYPFPVTARAYESYTFYSISYVSLEARAWATVSFVVALFALPWNTVIAALSGIITVVQGILCINTAVNGSKNHTRQRWDKYAIILQDNNRVWDEEWKEVDSLVTRINGIDYGPEILETWYTTHYLDILDYAINCYLNKVPW